MPRHIKVPKKILQQIKSRDSSQATKNTPPTTPEECFEKAAEEEESGDRWISSDLSKALRFYQRAYALYVGVLIQQPDHLDAKYNASRLLFNVYTEYIKNEGVNLTELTNCSDALTGTTSSVIQSLPSIIQFYKNSIESVNGSDSPWDLYYNAAMCYFEYVEDVTRNGYDNEGQFDEALGGMKEAQELFLGVLQFQVKAVAESAKDEHHSECESDEESEETNDTITPSSILETCLNCYRLVSAVFEDAWSEERVRRVKELSAEFIQTVDSVSSDVLVSSANVLLEQAEVEELYLAKVAFLASQCLTYGQCQQVWQAPELEGLENRVDKILIEADSYRTVLDKLDEANSALNTPDLRWKVLAPMDKLYKTAYKLLKTELDEFKNGTRKDPGDGRSGVICQICSVFIEQADIALERALVSTSIEGVAKYHDVLLKNCHNLLKSALTYSTVKPGLRESVSGKLLRQKRKREVSSRLCILDGKTSPQELDMLVGSQYWLQEVADLKDIAVYEGLINSAGL